jgi:hypothetical protein
MKPKRACFDIFDIFAYHNIFRVSKICDGGKPVPGPTKKEGT